MPLKTFFSKYKLPIVSIIICAAAFFLLSMNDSPLTGRFISSEPKIIVQSRASLYEAGFDENGAKIYALANGGESPADILISAKCSEVPVKIYLPETGWRDLPETNSRRELCLADNIPPNSTLLGYKIEAEGNYSGKILSIISIKSYGSSETDICKKAGEYASEN